MSRRKRRDHKSGSEMSRRRPSTRHRKGDHHGPCKNGCHLDTKRPLIQKLRDHADELDDPFWDIPWQGPCPAFGHPQNFAMDNPALVGSILELAFPVAVSPREKRLSHVSSLIDAAFRNDLASRSKTPWVTPKGTNAAARATTAAWAAIQWPEENSLDAMLTLARINEQFLQSPSKRNHGDPALRRPMTKRDRRTSLALVENARLFFEGRPKGAPSVHLKAPDRDGIPVTGTADWLGELELWEIKARRAKPTTLDSIQLLGYLSLIRAENPRRFSNLALVGLYEAAGDTFWWASIEDIDPELLSATDDLLDLA